MRIGQLIGKITSGVALICAAAGCNSKTNVTSQSPGDMFSFKPMDYGVYRQTLLKSVDRTNVLDVAEQRGRLLILKEQGIISPEEFDRRFAVVQIQRDVHYEKARTNNGYRACGALNHAEVKGMLDQLLDDGVITKERHEFMSSRLSGAPGFAGANYPYLKGLRTEKEVIDKAYADGIIDDDTKTYFNTPDWFKLAIDDRDVKGLFEALTFGVKERKISSELANKFARASHYEIANRVARLQIAGRLKPQDSEAILIALNKKFVSPREQFPFASIFFQENYFERDNVIPRLAVNDVAAGRIQPPKALDINERVKASQSSTHCLSGIDAEIKGFYKELGIDMYEIGLN